MSLFIGQCLREPSSTLVLLYGVLRILMPFWVLGFHDVDGGVNSGFRRGTYYIGRRYGHGAMAHRELPSSLIDCHDAVRTVSTSLRVLTEHT